jgi:hypothetical protein
MKCRLVMEDWRQVGNAESIYSTPLGVSLSMGDMHSGTTFEAVVELSPDIATEIETAWREHGAYPVLRLMPNASVSIPGDEPGYAPRDC